VTTRTLQIQEKRKLLLLRECKPPPKHLTSTQSNPVFESGFPIYSDSDQDVCRIAPKMLWLHHLLGIIYFAEYHENQPVTI